MREDMHPVGQYEAFDALAKQGKAIADTAVRFGTAETIVRMSVALDTASSMIDRIRHDLVGLKMGPVRSRLSITLFVAWIMANSPHWKPSTSCSPRS